MKEKKELLKFWLLLLSSVIVVYILPKPINYAFFSFVIYKFIKSKSDIYFWIAFWFVIIDFPSGLFIYGGEYRQIPYIQIPLSSGIFSFVQFVPIILFVKAILNNKKIVFQRDLIILLLIFFYLILVGAIYGMNMNSIFKTIELLTRLTLIYSIPILLSGKSLNKFDKLVFAVVLLAFITQLFTLLTGKQLIDLFITNNTSIDYMKAGMDNTARVASSPYILLYSLHKALFYFFNKKKVFSKNYLFMIIAISFLSIFLTATRSWIIANIVLLILINLFFKDRVNLQFSFKLIFSVVILIVLVFALFPPVQFQIINSFKRVQAIEMAVSGDLTMDNSFYRVTHRIPLIMKYIKQKPFLGWGFSDTYWKHSDGHIGHHDMILNSGILFYPILMSVLIKWFLNIYMLSKRNYLVYVKYGNSPKVFALFLIYILIIHTTSSLFWGFHMRLDRIFLLSIIMAAYNSIANVMYDEEFNTKILTKEI